MNRLVVLRLTGSIHEGNWIEVPAECHDLMAARRDYTQVRLVPTGDLEWDGDRAAEVWVAEPRMAEWLAEHRTD